MINETFPGLSRKLKAAAAGLVLFAAGCAATTYDGGGIVADRCIPMEADYNLKEGDTLHIGVGDLSLDPAGSLQDGVDVRLSGGKLDITNLALTGDKGDAGDKGDEHPVVLSEDGANQTFEEGGSRMTFALKPPVDGAVTSTLHMVKTCPSKSR